MILHSTHRVCGLLLLLAAASSAFGQAVPTAGVATAAPSSFRRVLPSIDGQLGYGVSASEIVSTGYGQNSDLYYTTNLSGDLIYTSKSTVRPFSAVYAGGVLISNQSNQSTQPYQSLTLSQGLLRGLWNFNISDSVSYLPSSPTLGLAGVPGSGDLGSTPVFTGEVPAQTVLTTNLNRVSNSVSGQVSRTLTPRTSLSGSVSYGILRYLGDGFGLDNNSLVSAVSLNREFDARDTGSVSATYSIFSFPGSYSFISRGVNVGINRRVTRNLTADASGGPLWINGSGSLAIPSQLNFAANAGVTYVLGHANVGVHFTRGVNGGSGVQAGALSTSVQAVYQREFGRDWSFSLSQVYFHSAGLAQGSNLALAQDPLLAQYLLTGTVNSSYTGVQVSRRFTDNLSGFASYTAQEQSFDKSLQLNPAALSGLSNVFGIGVTFSPRATRLGQF